MLQFFLQYNDLMKKKRIVLNDKDKIASVIKELDEKKNEALRNAWKKVNKVTWVPYGSRASVYRLDVLTPSYWETQAHVLYTARISNVVGALCDDKDIDKLTLFSVY